MLLSWHGPGLGWSHPWGAAPGLGGTRRTTRVHCLFCPVQQSDNCAERLELHQPEDPQLRVNCVGT